MHTYGTHVCYFLFKRKKILKYEVGKRSLAGEIFADGMSLLQSSCYQARQTRISTAYKRDHKHHSSDYFVRKKNVMIVYFQTSSCYRVQIANNMLNFFLQLAHNEEAGKSNNFLSSLHKIRSKQIHGHVQEN